MTNQQPEHGPPGMSEEQRALMRAAAKRMDRVNEWLHVGGALTPEEYERFAQSGITHVLDLREEEIPGVENLVGLGISRSQVPVPNGSAPTVEQLDEVVQWFDADGGTSTLYVHCQGGFGRACTMAVGLLIERGASLDDAVQQVREARPEMRVNNEQLVWLHSVEERRKAAR
ncbi:MAG TPA: protein-tyrosine phosphatase family protein [Dehalococcoidia bacterium]|nr:protein-tyrosine phosphatase family protein [Dehalococcoidia bacterium]